VGAGILVGSARRPLVVTRAQDGDQCSPSAAVVPAGSAVETVERPGGTPRLEGNDATPLPHASYPRERPRCEVAHAGVGDDGTGTTLFVFNLNEFG
jgi:hypothetical protein